MRDKGWKILLCFAAAFSLIMIFLTLYGDEGWQDVRLFQEEMDELQRKIELLQQENQLLAEEIQKLRDEPYSYYYIEKIAREELGLVRPGEKVFIITRRKKD